MVQTLIWKRVPSIPRFIVSSAGKVKYCNGKSVEVYCARNYLHVVIRVGRDSVQWIPVHKMVAEAFHGPRPKGKQINHKDLDKSHNAAKNLEYVTQYENIQHAKANGVIYGQRRGCKGNRPKLRDVDVLRLRQLSKEGWKQRDLARRFEISQPQVSHILSGKHWQWLGESHAH